MRLQSIKQFITWRNLQKLIFHIRRPMQRIFSYAMIKRKTFITVRGDKRVNLKEFRKANGTRPLSFASEENLMDIMGLIPGAVTPLGILNDTEKKVHFYLDEHFLEEPGLVGVHPNDNTATVWLKTEDLIRILEEHEHDVTLVSLD